MQSSDILKIFKENGMSYFTGVPDCTFQSFINELYSAERITHRVAVDSKRIIMIIKYLFERIIPLHLNYKAQR